MPKFRAHKYTWSRPYTSIRHQWELIGPTGGIHFYVSISSDLNYPGDSCGLEFHHSFPPDSVSAPGDISCWLMGGRCWHDGTSLYAEEKVWPIVKGLLHDGSHDMIFRFLESEYIAHFERDRS